MRETSLFYIIFHSQGSEILPVSFQHNFEVLRYIIAVVRLTGHLDLDRLAIVRGVVLEVCIVSSGR